MTHLPEVSHSRPVHHARPWTWPPAASRRPHPACRHPADAPAGPRSPPNGPDPQTCLATRLSGPLARFSPVLPRAESRVGRRPIGRRKPAPTVGFVLEEHTLTRPLGGTAALKEQLACILDVGEQRNVQIQVMPHNREVHAGLNGPMILLETSERKQLAYVDGPSGGYFVTEQPGVGDLFARYGILRAQALSPEESAKLIEQVASEL
ncbi:DUF5753 domain-containing protein [Streptomyces sp. HC307]|uniref:DUF5753 domain-containing protein n=1 Tax=Streptomyces flavusporus TaxID=3385496 RepID=UPI0039173352